MVDDIISELKPKMQASLENLRDDLRKVRTGRAHAGILDGIMVPYYGSPTPLREMATISVPEPTSIAIKPWDKNALSDIETAIRASDLGLSPINDGTQVRLNLPHMTEERRKEIVAQVKKYGEQAKISIRNIRGEAWSKIQQAVKNSEATEDDKYRAEDELNKLVLEKNKEIDAIVSEKETEIMKI